MAAVLRPRPLPRPLRGGPELRSRISRPSVGLRLRKSFRAKMAMEMRLPVARKPLSDSLGRESKKHLVVPGDTITTDTGFMRYVGTWGLGGHRGSSGALHVACRPKLGLCPLVSKPPRAPGHISRASQSPGFRGLGLLLPTSVCPRLRLFRPLETFLSRSLVAVILGSSA